MAVSDDFKSRFPEFDAVTVDQYIPILDLSGRVTGAGIMLPPAVRRSF